MDWFVMRAGRLVTVSGTMSRLMLACIVLVTIYPALGHAHDVIAQRKTDLLKESGSNSKIMMTLEPGDEVKLLENLPVNGYYHVFHKAGNGWVSVEDTIVRQEYRRSDWRHWTDSDKDKRDTRTEVLIEESLEKVTFDEKGNVATGKWRDPYTGNVIHDAKRIDIDHMVPLQNAHVSGGWLWSWERRRDYANDEKDPEHLIAVEDKVNRSKGARGPDEWKPALEEYWCEYATNWERIKRQWGLTMTAGEQRAVQDMKSMCP